MKGFPLNFRSNLMFYFLIVYGILVITGCFSKKSQVNPENVVLNRLPDGPQKKKPSPKVLNKQSKKDLEFGLQQYYAGNYSLAEFYIKKTLIHSPENPVALKTLPWIFFNQNQFDKALNNFEKVHTKYPRNPKYLIGMGWCYLALQSYEKALISFKKAKSLNTESFQATKGISYSHLFLKQFDLAKIELEQIYPFQYVYELINEWSKSENNQPYKPHYAFQNPKSPIKIFASEAEAPRYRSILFTLPKHKKSLKIQKAWEAYNQKRYKKALRLIQSLPPEQQKTLDAKNGLAWCLLKNEELIEARILFLEILDQNPGFIGAQQGLKSVDEVLKTKSLVAKRYYDWGKYSLSKNLYKKLIRKYPEWSHPWSMLGWIYFDNNDPETAAEYFQKALLRNPNDPDALKGIDHLQAPDSDRLELADKAFAEGNFKTASHLYYEYIQDHKHEAILTNSLSKAYSKLGYSQIEKGQYKLAIQNFERLSPSKKHNLERIKGLGLANFYIGNYDLATQYLIQVEQLQPKQKDFSHELDWSVLLSWDTKTSKHYFLEKVKSLPKQSSAYMALGWLYYKFEDPDLGVEYFLKATELEPDIAYSDQFRELIDRERYGWQIYNHLGWAYYHKGKNNISVEHFKYALHKYPRSSEAMKGLGYNYLILKNYKLAEDYLKKSIKRNPEATPIKEAAKFVGNNRTTHIITSAQTKLGLVLIKQKKYNEALNTFLKELKRHPNWPQVHTGLGLVYLKLNRLIESRHAFKKALHHQPLDFQAKNGLRKVKQLLALQNM